MRDDQVIPNLGQPPDQYDKRFMESLLRKLEKYMQNTRSRGRINVEHINVSSLPTSSVGLNTGDLWNDAGTVKVV